MSKRESPITRAFWKQTGGTLVEEFPVVKAGKDHARRLIDGIIILNGPMKIAKPSEVELEGMDIICIQTKASRLGMYLMGQALFSKLLLEKNFNPKSVRSVALCTKNDNVLEPLLKKFNVEVVIMDSL
ncbi:MAG: hypothetical protein H6557_08750 [Lewinellaceae bacterium]|nr:hypothetical protein [Lewinellaceae bacterium]